MTAHSRLAAEAAAWARERKLPNGPRNRDHFVIEPDGRLWRLCIFPRRGRPTIIEGRTRGEANRRRLDLSSEGFIGKVVGGA